MSALKLLFTGTTAQDNHITNFTNIFTADYKVYELHFEHNGNNNGSADLGFLTDEGVPLVGKQSYNNRFIYSHTSTSDSDNQNVKSLNAMMANAKYSFAVVKIFSPFEADKKTTAMTMQMGYSSTSVVTSLPSFGAVYEPSSITGISIIPEYSTGNAGTLRVYGVA